MAETITQYVIQAPANLNLKAVGYDGVDISMAKVDGVTILRITDPDVTMELVVKRRRKRSGGNNTQVTKPSAIYTVPASEQVGAHVEEKGGEEVTDNPKMMQDEENGDEAIDDQNAVSNEDDNIQDETVVDSETTGVKRGPRASIWAKHLKALMLHKQRTGRCSNFNHKTQAKLARWVDYLRAAHKKGKLSKERVAILEELGLNLKCEDKKSFWDDRYNELLHYKEQFGDCEVPKNYAPYPKLGVWIRTQRSAYKDGNMSEEKIAKLTEIGFRFGWVHHDNRWDMRYAELEEFKRQFGHCVVPHNYDDNPKLAQWVIHQRKQFKNRQLKDQRFEKLHDIGFVWNAPNTGKKQLLVPTSKQNDEEPTQNDEVVGDAKISASADGNDANVPDNDNAARSMDQLQRAGRGI